MYFDFEDYRPELNRIERAISWREGVLLSIIVHLLGVIGLLTLPRFLPAATKPANVLALAQPPEQNPRFVFVQPRVDLRALRPPPRADSSDQDRAARARERAPNPTNPLPYSRGNTSERVDQLQQRTARGEANPQPPREAPPEPPQQTRMPESVSPLSVPSQPQVARNGANGHTVFSPGSLEEAVRRAVQNMRFDNPQGGGGEPGSSIQFDTKGVEFGPWIRRFVALIKRNWNVPEAAMFMKGHVVITFNIHKDGSITDLAIAAPCPIEAFNTAAYGALVASSGALPLPPEYPAEKAFFTVTFYYNEQVQ